MKQKLVPFVALVTASIFVILLLGLISSSDTTVLAAGERESLVQLSGIKVLAEPATVITVTSGLDPDDSKSTECADVLADKCTLRRAIVEARDSAKPVLIKFDIPTSSAEGYDSSLKIWKINIDPTTTDTVIFRRLNGEIIIDGTTQPNGRSDGPKIMIVGPGTGSKDGLIVGDIAGDNGNEIRGLGFQNLKTHAESPGKTRVSSGPRR